MIFVLDEDGRLAHRPGCYHINELESYRIINTLVTDFPKSRYRGCPHCCNLIDMYNEHKEDIKQVLADIPHSIHYDDQFIYIETVKNTWRLGLKNTNQSIHLCRQLVPGSEQFPRVSEMPKQYEIMPVIEYVRDIENSKIKVGTIAPYENAIKTQVKEKSFQYYITGEGKNQTLYVRTEQAFWKVRFSKRQGLYLLEHSPFNDRSAKPIEEAEHAKYHDQLDAGVRSTPEGFFQYIREHDSAKALIKEGGYKALPRSTKRQKKYYDLAKRKQRQKEIDRTMRIFEKIERELSTKQKF